MPNTTDQREKKRKPEDTRHQNKKKPEPKDTAGQKRTTEKKKGEDTAGQKRAKDTAGKKKQDDKKGKHSDRGTGHNQVAKVTGEMEHLDLGYNPEKHAASQKRVASPARPKTGTPVDFQVHGSFVPQGSPLKASYMASTGPASAPTSSNEPVKLQGSGLGMRLVAHVTIAGRTVKALVDTGAGFTIFHRSVFPSDPQYHATRQVPNSSKLRYHFATLGVTDWKSGDAYVDTLRLHRRGDPYEVRNFQFYVVDDPLFGDEVKGLLGFGPEYRIHRNDHVVEYAPSIFNHIVDQEGLTHRTMSIYISPWVENHPYTFATDIKIGVDPRDPRIVWLITSSAQSAAHLHSFDVKLALKKGSGQERDIIPRENNGAYNDRDVTTISDTGTPGIILSTKMFDAVCEALTSMRFHPRLVQNGTQTLIEVPDTEKDSLKSLIVKIGTKRQQVLGRELWFPPEASRPYYQDHTRSVLIGESQQAAYDVGLGIPYAHLRTQVLDNPSDRDPARRRIGYLESQV